MRRGEIVLAVLPFTDLSGQKHRPALIVSSDSRIGDDVLVAFVTSYHGQVVFSTEVLLLDSDADFSQTRLKRSSVIKADKLFTIHKDLILGKIGTLSQHLMQQVDQCLRLALEL